LILQNNTKFLDQKIPMANSKSSYVY